MAEFEPIERPHFRGNLRRSFGVMFCLVLSACWACNDGDTSPANTGDLRFLYAINPNPVSATYLTLDHRFDPSQWRHEFQVMKRYGIDTIAIAGVYNGDSNASYYPSSIAGTILAYGYDVLEQVLTIADQLGFTVYIGPLEINSQWWGADFRHAVSLHNHVAQEVHTKYKSSHPSFKGWYIRQEVLLNDIIQWGTGVGTVQFQKQVAAYLDSISTLPILTPPYFIMRTGPEGGTVTSPTPTQVKDAMNAYLTEVPNLDIVALQDGIGAMHVELNQLSSYYSAVKQATDAHAKILWSEFENFEYTGSTTGLWWKPAFLPRMKRQLGAEQPYVSKFITWVFNQFQSDQSEYYPTDATRLHHEFVSDVLTPNTWSAGRAYTCTTAPSSTYPDSGGKLTNGAHGDETSWAPWVGWNNVTSLTISMDLGSSREIRYVRALATSQTTLSIYYPTSVSVTVSDDGISYRTFGWTSKYPTDRSGRRPNWAVVIGFDHARYVKLTFTQSTARWTMLSAIEIKGGIGVVDTNLAIGKTYTISPSPSSSYPDSESKKLTDGAGSMNFGGSVGWTTGSTSVTVTLVLNLGASYELQAARVNTGGGEFGLSGGSDYRATQVDVYTSTDGTTYTLRGTDTTSRAWMGATFDATARYVKFAVTKAYGGYGKEWLFVGELEAIGSGLSR